ncbi:MAG: CPBP family glutamic-type intramembrane protease [Planctomycetota bacterium]
MRFVSLAALRSSQPTPNIRLLLLAEAVLYVAALTAYVYLALPSGEDRTLQFLFVPLLVAFPFVMNLIHNESRKQSGLRLDNLRASAREVALVLLAAVTVVGVVGLIAGTWQAPDARRFFKKLFLYAAWGPFQQYVLCAFIYNRLRQALYTDNGAAFCAAALFGLVHSPNWVLVGVTLVFGFISCHLFRRHANILTLGLAHAVLAIVIYYAWPPEWHHGMTIGGIYLHRMAGPLP